MGARDEKGRGGIGRERLSAGACLAEGIQDYKLSFPEARLAGSENPRQPASSRLHAQTQARRSWVPNCACKHAKGTRTQTAGQTACLLGPWLCCCGHHRGDGRTRSSLGGEGTSPTGPQGPCPQAQTLGSLVGRPRPIAPPYLGAEGAARQLQRSSAGALAPAGPHALQEPRSALPLASPSCASLGHGPASGSGSSSPTDTPSRPGLRPPQSCSGHLRPPAPPRHCLISSHTLLSAPKAGFGFGFDSAALIPRPSAPACHHRTLQPLFHHPPRHPPPTSGFSEVPSQTGPAQGVPRLRA